MAFGALAMKGAKALGGVDLSALKRTKESRDCIDSKKAQGKTGREARKECRKIYGSRFGNAGRALGILPEALKGVSVSQFLNKRSVKNTPDPMGTVNQGIIPSMGVKKASPNYNMTFLLIGLGVLAFANRKIFGF